MHSIAKWTEWINFKDQEQLKWIAQYLSDTLRIHEQQEFAPGQLNVEYLTHALGNRPDVWTDGEKLVKMKRAWRKQKQRLKARSEKKKQVTLFISATAQRQLRGLVSLSEEKTSASKIIEELIAKETIVRKAETEAEKQERQKNKIGQIMSQKLAGQAPKIMQPAYPSVMPNIPSAGRYVGAGHVDFGHSQNTSVNSELTQAQEMIDQLRNAVHDSTALLAKMEAMMLDHDTNDTPLPEPPDSTQQPVIDDQNDRSSETTGGLEATTCPIEKEIADALRKRGLADRW